LPFHITDLQRDIKDYQNSIQNHKSVESLRILYNTFESRLR